MSYSQSESIGEQSSVGRLDVIQIGALYSSSQTGSEISYKSLYSISDEFHIGWGAGFVSYNTTLRRSFIPVTFEVMGEIGSSGFTPFYTFSLGYGIALPEESDFAESARGGFKLESGIGIRSKSKTMQPFFKLTYHNQFASYPGEDIYGNIDKKVVYKRLNFVIGVIF